MARADEQARQDKIRAGTQRINGIFDGTASGKRGVNPVTGPLDPNRTYYNADGTVYSPQGGRQGRGQMAAPDVYEGVVDNAQNTAAGVFNGFNDQFFNGRRQAYIDYAQPQLDTQYNDARRQLTYALARSGTLDSSERARQEGVLQREYDVQRQNIADQGLSYSTQARTAVEDARANLIATLNATGDTEGATNAAIARAQTLSQPAAFSPLGQLFANFTNALGTQAAMERASALSGGAYTPRYNTGLFGTSRSVRVT